MSVRDTPFLRGSIGASLLVGLTLTLALLLSAPAGADVFGPLSLVSASPFQQVEYAHNPAISGDGRYVAFDGSIGGVRGVWRREIGGAGNLEEVAGGDAELPSISYDGQYVSFTTNEGARLGEITDGLPDPVHETHEAPNVYVRDMSTEPDQEGAFTLASPLSYEYSAGQSKEFEEENYGSQAAGRTALSADGRKVAFVTTAASNLDGPGTPPLQVAVHDLETGVTELVSVEDDPASGRPALEAGHAKPVQIEREGNTVLGAAYTPGSGGPPLFGTGTRTGVGASISADGSTIAWMAQDLGEQVQTLPAEALPAKYAEPLWRRIGEGEQAPTRRVTGGSDPTNPQCAANPEASLPEPAAQTLSDPCQGPFRTAPSTGVWNLAGNIPVLSATGETVAFIANQPTVALGSDFNSGSGDASRTSDLYVVDMREGLTRVQALRPLTQLASGNETDVANDANILEIAISADGQQVAFTTRRTVFPLGSPAFVSAPASVPGLGELFNVDLQDDTLTRVTHGYEGGPGEQPHAELGEVDPYSEGQGALSPSFSSGGELLAFSSTASNLVYGDGNTPPLKAAGDGSDAFVVNRIVFSSSAEPQVISPVPPGPSLAPAWTLGVTARSLANGSVVLYAELPGAGTLSASASSAVKSAPQRSKSAAKRSASGKSSKSARTSVLTRTVSAARGVLGAGGDGLASLSLKLAHSYAALAARKGGLSASVTVSFSAPGHPTLHQTVAVTFVRKPKPRRAPSSKDARTHSRPGQRR
jgi:WD40-like Beta Propeller Repeat